MIRKLLRAIIFILIVLFVFGVIDYFLIRAGLISVDTSQLPDFLKALFPN